MFRKSCLSLCSAPSCRNLSAAFCSANKAQVQRVYGTNFTISKRCWDRIDAKNSEEKIANNDRFLRLAVESGGCHGYMYKFQFDKEIDEEQDVVFSELECDADGFKARAAAKGAAAAGMEVTAPVVVVDKSTSDCMAGAVLDYHSELKGSAFVVVGNEKVDHLCACAMSFSVKK